MNKRIIKHLLDTKGMKWKFLLDRSGVSKRTFYAYLNGEWSVPNEFKIKLALALDVPVSVIESKKEVA
jgi:transcriptional regulator with XRE-family HTH domain